VPKESEKKPFGYWTKNGNSNIKQFLDDFAGKRGLDPRDPETWYPISKKHIIDIDVCLPLFSLLPLSIHDTDFNYFLKGWGVGNRPLWVDADTRTDGRVSRHRFARTQISPHEK
jgi:hypothetical protein